MKSSHTQGRWKSPSDVEEKKEKNNFPNSACVTLPGKCMHLRDRGKPGVFVCMTPFLFYLRGWSCQYIIARYLSAGHRSPRKVSYQSVIPPNTLQLLNSWKVTLHICISFPFVKTRYHHHPCLCDLLSVLYNSVEALWVCAWIQCMQVLGWDKC